MTDAHAETRETLWITDAELIRRIGAPEKIAREALHMLDRDRSSGFPKPNPLAGGCRNWRDVVDWFDRVNGLHDVPAKPPRYGAAPETRSVYFIRSGNHIKIGIATGAPKRRMGALSTAHYDKLELLACIPNSDPETERALHKRFAEFRVRGEWFRAEPELLAYIETVKSKP